MNSDVLTPETFYNVLRKVQSVDLPQILCWFCCVQSLSIHWHFCRPKGENALWFGVLLLCASVGRESRASLWRTPHDSLTPFNSSHGKTLRSFLSVSLKGVRPPFHHPAFIPVFLSQHRNSLESPFLFLHTFWVVVLRVSVFPLCLFLSFSLGFVHLLWTFSLSLSLFLVRLRAFCSFHTGLSFMYSSLNL